MSTKQRVIFGSAAAVGAVAVGVAAHRATHPAEARGPVSEDPGRSRVPVEDALFELPADVVHHELAAKDGGVVHAIEKGSGRPLVLLHGITLRSDVWAPQFHQLVDRYRVVAVDLRGHGASQAGGDGFGLPRLAADLAVVLEELDLRDAIIVGHSMGGMTVMEFCGLFPEVLAERVAGLVFVATRAHQVMPPYVDLLARRLVARGQSLLDGGGTLPARATVSTRLARLAFGERPAARAVRIVAEMGQSMDPRALLPSLDGLFDHDARAALRATSTPSLVVVGTRDLLTPVPAARHLARLLPASDFVVLPRAGHQLMQERPAELAELVDAFAATLSGTAASVRAAVSASSGPVGGGQVEDTSPGVASER